MKYLGIFFVGIICAVVFLKWDLIREKLTESSSQSVTYAPSNSNLTAEEKLELASAWQNGGKRRCVERLNMMKTALDNRISCPAYCYDKSFLTEAQTAIKKYERAIGYDDYCSAERLDNDATDAIRRFEMNCRWKSGVSRGDGTHSGLVEGTWEPDSGRVMVNGRAVRVFRCNNCSGQGQVRVTEFCPSCNGRGSVPNPAAQVTDSINMGVEIASMFGKGGDYIRTPNVPREIRCSSCNGQGRRQVIHICPQCNGKGEIYEP